ncbi:unnamed protein product [Auanema sp. JU1783]|nr:unnamed protein product [Auanema sp. JU1783]
MDLKEFIAGGKEPSAKIDGVAFAVISIAVFVGIFTAIKLCNICVTKNINPHLDGDEVEHASHTHTAITLKGSSGNRYSVA